MTQVLICRLLVAMSFRDLQASPELRYGRFRHSHVPVFLTS
jgi:hypothetical protein